MDQAHSHSLLEVLQGAAHRPASPAHSAQGWAQAARLGQSPLSCTAPGHTRSARHIVAYPATFLPALDAALGTLHLPSLHHP